MIEALTILPHESSISTTNLALSPNAHKLPRKLTPSIITSNFTIGHILMDILTEDFSTTGVEDRTDSLEMTIRSQIGKLEQRHSRSSDCCRPGSMQRYQNLRLSIRHDESTNVNGTLYLQSGNKSPCKLGPLPVFHRPVDKRTLSTLPRWSYLANW